MKQGVPLPLTHNGNFNRVLHERVLLVAIEMTETPRVDDAERVTVTALSDRIARIELKFGFMEKADVPEGLQVAVARGQRRKAIFALMHRNAQQPGAFFNIPGAQVMEIGVEFEI
jgi:KUP system potassium uptake protein